MNPNLSARFDDLVSGTAIEFDTVDEVLDAHSLEQVRPVLAAVDRASRDGQWAYGFLSYEAAPAFDSRFRTRDPYPGLPLAWFAIGGTPASVPITQPPTEKRYRVGPWQNLWTADEYQSRVRAVLDRIAAGDTYQCNLTTRLRSPFSGDAQAMYTDLVLAQCGAHNAYLDIGSYAIASASPELFFDLNESRLLLRPMKGTAPRGRSISEDELAVARLLASEKERAENVMIVDLLRNDASRIAEIGGVTVPRLLHAEKYPTVHQLTSDIHAQVTAETTLVDVFTALFPCGSITGAPKHSTMDLIQELESAPRGVYCGAIGYVAPTTDGQISARFSVAIRTVTIDRATHTAEYGAGGGVTWSSEPAAEYDESNLKAAILTTRQPPVNRSKDAPPQRGPVQITV